MRNLELVGLSEDGTSVVLSDAQTGEKFTVTLDSRLRAAVVHDRVRLGQLELALNSPLRPKEIQARIRAGQSTEEVAAAAGMTVERVMRFASPVLAEREHVATQAQRSVLRRPGAHDPRSLADAVAERLDGRGVPPASLVWDAWRRDDSKWSVSVSYRSGERLRAAHFVYDPLARVVVTDDDESRWLAGEPGPLKGPQPRTGSTSSVPAQPTRSDDERAVELANEGRALRLAPIESDDEADNTAGDPELFDGPFRRRLEAAPEPVAEPDLPVELPVEAFLEPAPAHDPEDDASTMAIPRIDPDDLGPDEWVDLDEPDLEPEPEPEPDVVPEVQVAAVEPDRVPEPEAVSEPDPEPELKPEPDPEPEPTPVVEPEPVPDPEPAPKPAAKTARKSRRAAVPSWDDILFGAKNEN